MPDQTITPIAPEYQGASFPLPDYRSLFRLHSWLENTLCDYASELGVMPPPLQDALFAIGRLVECAMEREGKTYAEMLRAIHSGEFD